MTFPLSSVLQERAPEPKFSECLGPLFTPLWGCRAGLGGMAAALAGAQEVRRPLCYKRVGTEVYK